MWGTLLYRRSAAVRVKAKCRGSFALKSGAQDDGAEAELRVTVRVMVHEATTVRKDGLPMVTGAHRLPEFGPP